MSIKGNGVGTPVPRTNWNQTDPTKADYLKGRDDLLRIIENTQSSASGAQSSASGAQSSADNARAAVNDHKNDTGNPHGVTCNQIGARPNNWLPSLAEIGAAPAGLNNETVQFVLSENELNSALATVYNGMADYSVKFKIIHVNASGLSLGGGSWQFVINRADANYGTIYGSCYNYNGFVYRILHGGSWGEWQRYTPSNFAPAGYGLGKAQPFSAADIDSITRPGFYYLKDILLEEGYPISKMWLEVSACEDGATFATQRVRYLVEGVIVEMIRHKVNGFWGEFEVVNPAMVPGVEFSTTELWCGAPVYTKLIQWESTLDFAGTVSASVPHGISNIDVRSARIEATTFFPSYDIKNGVSSAWVFPHYSVSSQEALYVQKITDTDIIVRSEGGASWDEGRTFYFILKYCKK